MGVKLISYSQPSEELLKEGIKNINDLVSFCARVSNPSNQYNTETSEKLIKYLKKNKHWSPFETVNICLEIETTRDISRQILRHRSFAFQEFCVAEGTLINLYGENNKPIEELYECQDSEDFYTFYFDKQINQLKSVKIKEVFKTGKKPCFKLILDDSKSITCTEEHKFMKNDLEFYPLKELKVGDKIGTKRAIKNNVTYKTIVQILPMDPQETYDLEVDNEEHNYVCNGFISHNSTRYADPTKEMTFVIREARLQDTKNRQNSIVSEDETLQNEWKEKQEEVIKVAKEAYEWALSKGIAKEQARTVLPEGNILSRIYMNGSLRSWIHYIDVRSDPSTQKEHREIALYCAKVISQLVPNMNC